MDLGHHSPLVMSVTKDPVTSSQLCPLCSDPVRLHPVGEVMAVLGSLSAPGTLALRKQHLLQNLQASRQP